MLENPQDHPLHGVGLEAMLVELVQHYDWDILAAQIPVQCFSSHPSIKSSAKFLKKTLWARQRVEAFYLYRFKSLPLPDEEQHQLPPRERSVDLTNAPHLPAEITLGDREFFDDPISGPKRPSKEAVDKTQAAVRKRESTKRHRSRSADLVPQDSDATHSSANNQAGSVDPWAKWKKSNKKG